MSIRYSYPIYFSALLLLLAPCTQDELPDDTRMPEGQNPLQKAADTHNEEIDGQKPERDTELHYRNVLFIVFKLVGLYTQVEYRTSNGRIDLVLQTDRYVYIMEFKLNGTAEEALRQIEEKGYALPFAGDDREVFKSGVNFSAETRNIEKWLVG